MQVTYGENTMRNKLLAGIFAATMAVSGLVGAAPASASAPDIDQHSTISIVPSTGVVTGVPATYNNARQVDTNSEHFFIACRQNLASPGVFNWDDNTPGDMIPNFPQSPCIQISPGDQNSLNLSQAQVVGGNPLAFDDAAYSLYTQIFYVHATYGVFLTNPRWGAHSVPVTFNRADLQQQPLQGGGGGGGGGGAGATPPPYTGPMITPPAGVIAASAGGKVTIPGSRLGGVSKVEIAGLDAQVTVNSDGSIEITLPRGLAAGVYDLVITSSSGRLTVQGAIRITGAASGATASGVAGEARPSTRMFAENTLKVWVFDAVGAGKVQIKLNGREVAWVNAASNDDPKLRDGYLVRTLTLAAGKNVIEVYVDGERVSRRVATGS